MAVISFIAKSSLAAGYISGQSYDIEFQCAQFEVDIEPVSEDSISLSGIRETVIHRRERSWDITTGAFIGAAADQFMCFLASALDGSPFTFDRYATISNGSIVVDRPILCELPNKGRRLRLGNRTDAYQFAFKIREIEDDTPLYGENYYWDLDLTRGVVPDGWTYTRTGTMYAMDTDGIFKPYAADVMPTHYDAVAGRQLGAWFGASVTNSLFYSSDFSSDTNWIRQNATKSAATSVIQGGTARKVTATNTSSAIYRDQGTFTGSAETFYAIIEKGDTDVTSIGLYNTTTSAFAARAQLVFSTGSVTVPAGTGTARAFKLQNVGPNGGEVWLLSLTTSAGVYLNNRQCLIYGVGLSSTTGYVYIHHAQLQQSSDVTSPPIVTTSAAISRGADVLTFTGNPNWWKGQDFTLAIDFERQDPNPAAGTPFLASVGSTVNDYSGLYTSGALTRSATSVVAGVTVSALNRNASANNRRSKFAARFSVNDFSTCLDGGSAATDTSGGISATGKFNVGSAPTNGSQAQSYISRAVFVPSAYSNSELQAWTG